jgi:TetR/AcrR family transcriptional repressor of nem operon
MGRKSDAGERLLAAGAELFGRRAYSSVGVAEICAAAGVPKGSFYYFFRSKQDLALSIVDTHWARQREQWVDILGQPGTAADRIRELFVATAQVQRDALADAGVVAGSLFGNLALELSSTEPGVRARLEEIFDSQVQMIEDALGEGSHDLATSVVAQLEGLVLMAKLRQDPSQVDAYWAPIARMLTSS